MEWNWKDAAARAVLTFVQAFLAVLLVTGVDSAAAWESVQPALIAAVAALLSLAYRLTKEYAAHRGFEE